MTSQASLSLSLSLYYYYSQKSLTHNMGSASALPIITRGGTQTARRSQWWGCPLRQSLLSIGRWRQNSLKRSDSNCAPRSVVRVTGRAKACYPLVDEGLDNGRGLHVRSPVSSPGWFWQLVEYLLRIEQKRQDGLACDVEPWCLSGSDSRKKERSELDGESEVSDFAPVLATIDQRFFSSLWWNLLASSGDCGTVHVVFTMSKLRRLCL